MDDLSDSDREGEGSCHLRWMGPTLGDSFPDLRGETQHTRNFSLHSYLGNSWGIVFMHPADFTPVCTTEIGAAQSLMDEFEARNVRICGFSCDDSSRHKAWLADVEAATGHRVEFPLFCDPSRMHAIELGVFDPKEKDNAGLPLTVRTVFVLNPKKEIALTMTYPVTVGRNFDEILRVVDALQRAEGYGVATPANWQPGDKTIVSHNVDDETAARKFGKNGFHTVDMPSERGKDLNKHYLRYCDDPVLTGSSRQSFKLAIRISKPKLSWRPPKSLALNMYLPGKKRESQTPSAEANPTERRKETQSFTSNDATEATAKSLGASLTEPQQARPSIDYSKHKPWKALLRPFTSLKSETCVQVETCEQVEQPKSGRRVSAPDPSDDNEPGELLVDFGKKGDRHSSVVW